MAETDTAPAVETGGSPPPFDEEAYVESQLSIEGVGGDAEKPAFSQRAIESKRQAIGKAAPAAEEPAEESAEQPQQPAPALSQDVAAMLAEARLRPVEGETTEQALHRLVLHNQGRARAHHSDLKTTRDEVASLKQMIQPLWQALRENQLAQEQEAAMRTVPDKETDQPGYQTWLLEQVLQRQERERQQAEEAQAANAREEQLVTLDEAALGDLYGGLEKDEEVRAGYSFALQAGMAVLEQQYPNSTPEQREEFVKLSQQLNMRNLVRQGMGVSDFYRGMYRNTRQLLGVNGNGHATAQEQPAAAPQQAAPPAQQQRQGSPTAARLRADSAAAAARAVVSPSPAATRAPTGEGIDLRALDEDEALELGLEYARTGRSAEWDAMVQAQFGKGRRR